MGANRRLKRLHERELDKASELLKDSAQTLSKMKELGIPKKERIDTYWAVYAILSAEFEAKYSTMTLNPNWLKEMIKNDESKTPLIKILV